MAKYKFTYYLNTARAENRPETKEDIDNDWRVEEREYPSDIEAFEYAYIEILKNDRETLDIVYENLFDPDDDLEKIYALKEEFEEQDIGNGAVFLISIEGPGQTYDNGLTKEDLLGELDESKKITENVNWSYFDKFKEITNKYLPDEGEGETLASQIVTAINKLVYKWYNDGDVYDNVNSGMQGWANDLSSYANWLDKYCDRAARILDSIYACSDDDTYEGILKALADKCLNPEYLATLENEPKQGSIYDCDGQYKFSEYSEEDEYDESLSLEEATMKTLSENLDEDEMDMYDLVENMIDKLNEISEEDGLYWEANEVYDNCAITEDETDQYMEIFVYKDKGGNIKYSTDEEHADSYDTVEDAYEACTWKSND